MNTPRPRVGVLVENLYQELEVWYPIYRFQEAGAAVTTIGPEMANYTSKLGYPVQADVSAANARADDLDVLVIPGGFAPDLMRTCAPMVALARAMNEQGKLIAAICHGTWLLVSAGALRGKRATGAPSIADDIRNAGATYVDAEAVCDGNIITSRKPADLPAFSSALFDCMADRFGRPHWS